MVRLVLATGALPPRRQGSGPNALYEPLPEPMPEGAPSAHADRGGVGQSAELRDALRQRAPVRLAGVVRLLLATGALPPRRPGSGPNALYEPLPEPMPEGAPSAHADRDGFGQPAELRQRAPVHVAGAVWLVLATGAPRRQGNGPEAVREPLPEPQGAPGARAGPGQPTELRDALLAAVRF
ncbi:hypothetical protein [Amycolatopsis tucumanensis]|uniref:hypothetical protein n=1 Tax=Amycolatopsis tucumanensis TaxID=401106 RepID=UPI003D7284F5